MPALYLVSTVGTSLLDKLDRNAFGNHPDIASAYQAQDWGQLAARLRAFAGDDPLCGAEINSIHELIARESLVAPDAHLHFCVSDTDKGRNTGQVLKAYYAAAGHPVTLHVITDLQDRDPDRFRVYGLRNLAREIGGVIRNAGAAQYVAINATGGFKGQIAIAVLIGQALESPVYYKHERFPTIVSLPPMPIALDYELLGRHADLLVALESGNVVELPEGAVDDKVRMLLEEVPSESGESLWALAPVGQVYLEGYRYRYPTQPTLPPPAEPDARSGPSFRDDHYPEGFKDFVEKVWRETPYITGCHSLSYEKQAGIRDRRFYIRESDGQIVGEYRHEWGARFGINTTAQTAAQRVAVVLDLTERYNRDAS